VIFDSPRRICRSTSGVKLTASAARFRRDGWGRWCRGSTSSSFTNEIYDVPPGLLVSPDEPSDQRRDDRARRRRHRAARRRAGDAGGWDVAVTAGGGVSEVLFCELRRRTCDEKKSDSVRINDATLTQPLPATRGSLLVADLSPSAAAKHKIGESCSLRRSPKYAGATIRSTFQHLLDEFVGGFVFYELAPHLRRAVAVPPLNLVVETHINPRLAYIVSRRNHLLSARDRKPFRACHIYYAQCPRSRGARTQHIALMRHSPACCLSQRGSSSLSSLRQLQAAHFATMCPLDCST